MEADCVLGSIASFNVKDHQPLRERGCNVVLARGIGLVTKVSAAATGGNYKHSLNGYLHKAKTGNTETTAQKQTTDKKGKGVLVSDFDPYGQALVRLKGLQTTDPLQNSVGSASSPLPAIGVYSDELQLRVKLSPAPATKQGAVVEHLASCPARD